MGTEKDRNMRRKLVIGNWKMNGLKADLAIAAEVAKGYDIGLKSAVDLAICPPASLLYLASAALVGSRIATGGQDCSLQEAGAFTGEVSAAMLAEAERDGSLPQLVIPVDFAGLPADLARTLREAARDAVKAYTAR